MNTIESWNNFTRYYGGVVGARDCFELACEDLLMVTLYRKISLKTIENRYYSRKAVV